MDLQRWIDNTLQIQSIPAPTFHEAARAEFMHGVFSSLNLLDVSMDEDHNVYARVRGGSKTPLVISAHLDSVFPQDTSLTHRREGNQLFGPGIGDNAVALGALIELAHDLNDSDPPSDVWLVANVGEEGLGNLLGMRKVVDRFGADVLAYLVLEGMALGHVYHRGLPIHRYQIIGSTVGGHAWIHAGRASAIHSICQLGARLSQISLPKAHRWSLNIGRIEGGTSINTIASTASMELDLRAENNDTLESLEKEVFAAINETDTPEVSLEMKEIGNRPAGQLAEDHPLVKAACHALHKAGIRECQLEAGSTDASVPLSLNYPSVCIGLTFGSGAHSLEEYIEIQPLKVGYRALRMTMETCYSMG
jgi:acetylornithine deacetylase/succinyl-diaminopimelate desuccinylase-like protein